MKFSEPLLVKPSRNLTMLLAGKSREKCADQNLSLHKVTCSINIHISAEEPSRVTFSFDEQDGGVGVGRRLHLSN